MWQETEPNANQAIPTPDPTPASDTGIGQADLMPEIEREMKRVANPLPETPVTGFSCPLLLTTFRVKPDEARDRLLTALKAAKQNLPKSAKPERMVENIRPVLVPMWLISGSISGKWSATGIEVKTWEEQCPKCFGSGKTGSYSGQQSQCQSCWGSGKDKQSKKSKHIESGEASTEIQEFIDNNGTGVTLALDLDVKSSPKPLTDDEKARWSCIRPASIYHAAISDVVKNRLAASLDEKAKATMSQYDRIENLQYVGDSVKSQYEVSACLYPAYICWFEAGGNKHFAVCDAVTGKVTVPHFSTASASSAKTPKSKAVIITLVVLIALAIAGWFARSAFRTDQAKPPAMDPKAATFAPAPEAPAPVKEPAPSKPAKSHKKH